MEVDSRAGSHLNENQLGKQRAHEPEASEKTSTSAGEFIGFESMEILFQLETNIRHHITSALAGSLRVSTSIPKNVTA